MASKTWQEVKEEQRAALKAAEDAEKSTKAPPKPAPAPAPAPEAPKA